MWSVLRWADIVAVVNTCYDVVVVGEEVRFGRERGVDELIMQVRSR